MSLYSFYFFQSGDQTEVQYSSSGLPYMYVQKALINNTLSRELTRKTDDFQNRRNYSLAIVLRNQQIFRCVRKKAIRKRAGRLHKIYQLRIHEIIKLKISTCNILKTWIARCFARFVIPLRCLCAQLTESSQWRRKQFASGGTMPAPKIF